MNDRARADGSSLEGRRMGDTAARTKDSEREARAFRRLLRPFRSTGGYGLVLVMIVATYVLAVTLSGRWAATILLFTQMATVWVALRITVTRRGLRLAAHGLFVLTTIRSEEHTSELQSR